MAATRGTMDAARRYVAPMPDPFVEAAERVAAGADHHAEARSLVAAMTRDEKLGCLDGDTPFWPGVADMVGSGYREHVWPAARVERLGVPGISFSDGPRGCVVGSATAFPVSMARGATFDPALEERVGEAIGAELAARGATYTGAVCLNLLRHPAWGRAQETYGEDPHHVGELAAALTRGLQRHVMACMKHFALNSMENARFQVDVTVDERALHEVYLPHFKRVADEGVASVMSAYNSVNGAWCGESATLLTTILRDEWGWDGFVTSDFVFGVRDGPASVRAGLNIEMPFRQVRATTVPAALADGSLADADVDERVVETVATLLRFWPVIGPPAPGPDVVLSDAHRALAREVAHRSMVLLRNERSLLPVDPADLVRVAVIGRLAARANLGDGGSSDVHPGEVVTLLDGLRAGLVGVDVVHADDDAAVADDADLAVVVVGLTKADEGEYVDAAATAGAGVAVPPGRRPGGGPGRPAAPVHPPPQPGAERRAHGPRRRPPHTAPPRRRRGAHRGRGRPQPQHGGGGHGRQRRGHALGGVGGRRPAGLVPGDGGGPRAGRRGDGPGRTRGPPPLRHPHRRVPSDGRSTPTPPPPSTTCSTASGCSTGTSASRPSPSDGDSPTPISRSSTPGSSRPPTASTGPPGGCGPGWPTWGRGRARPWCRSTPACRCRTTSGPTAGSSGSPGWRWSRATRPRWC